MRKLTYPFVLLDDCSLQETERQSLLFDCSEHTITAYSLDEVPDALERLDGLVQSGFYAAGWISYEVAAAFEARLGAVVKVKSGEPLIWMMATREPQRLSKSDVEQLLRENQSGDVTLVPSADIPSFSHYSEKIARIQDYIAAGDVYQINYTFDQPFRVEGCTITLYGALRQRQPVQYGALIKTGDRDILSLSPELFIECRQGILIARPMKGTAPRGEDEKSDQALAEEMLGDEKSRAENLMIVDLLRNDLSRIADAGSVKVPALFEIEKYQTLLQMTSTIKATVSQPQKPSDVLSALFPCGSVTGAPKIRAMEIIGELEQRARGIYCGAIGYFTPDGDFTLSVPIRTATISKDVSGAMTVGTMGIGSGIVADSETAAEYDECALKARFLTELNPACDLIETLKYTPDEGMLRLDLHLERLAKSAAAFYRPINVVEIRDSLFNQTRSLTTDHRLRLTLARDGTAHLTASELVDAITSNAQTICFAGPPVASCNPMLQHKTTMRNLFDSIRREAIKKHGVLDVIFVNEKGEITEGAISNIFAEIDGVLITPPVRCGLLGGIMRQIILASPRQTKEAALSIQDIKRASHLYICNSVRELVPVSLLDVEPVFPAE